MAEVCLVTGGVGSIGSRVAKKLHDSGNEVIILDNLSAYPFDYYREFGLQELHIRFIKGDLRDKALLSELVPKVDRIIHLAALADVAECTLKPQEEFDINILGTQSLLDAAVNSKIKKFTFISSASVYGSPNGLFERRFKESQGCFPVSNYGLSKLWGEQRCLMYHKFYRLPATALRLFSIYGSPQVPKFGSHSWCVAIFAMQLKLGKPLTVFGDGEQIRDFVHVSDAADAIVLATMGDNGIGRVFNIGTGLPTSINRICDLLCLLTNSSKNMEYLPSRDDDPLGGCADTSQCKAILGWQHKIALQDGIGEYLNWLDKNEHLIPDFL